MTHKPGFRFTPNQIDKIVCDFSMARGHAFSEKDLEFLVLSIMNQANAILDSYVATLPEVFGRGLDPDERDMAWTREYSDEAQDLGNTHSARLWGVTELSKPEGKDGP